MLALRALARLVAFLLFAALALAGLAIALFSIQGGDKPLSLPALASHLQLPEVEEEARDYLGRLEADGPLARVSALVGVGAAAAGVLLLLGVLAPRRERLVVFERGEAGRLAARRRALAGVAEALAEGARGVTDAKAHVRPRGRLRRGRLRLKVSHPRTHTDREIEERVRGAVYPLVDSSGLRPRVDATTGRRGARVE